MLYTIVIVLLALWLIGLLAGTTVHGLLHILLVVAVVMLVLRLLTGRKTI